MNVYSQATTNSDMTMWAMTVKLEPIMRPANEANDS